MTMCDGRQSYVNTKSMPTSSEKRVELCLPLDLIVRQDSRNEFNTRWTRDGWKSSWMVSSSSCEKPGKPAAWRSSPVVQLLLRQRHVCTSSLFDSTYSYSGPVHAVHCSSGSHFQGLLCRWRSCSRSRSVSASNPARKDRSTIEREGDEGGEGRE